MRPGEGANSALCVCCHAYANRQLPSCKHGLDVLLQALIPSLSEVGVSKAFWAPRERGARALEERLGAKKAAALPASADSGAPGSPEKMAVADTAV